MITLANPERRGDFSNCVRAIGYFSLYWVMCPDRQTAQFLRVSRGQFKLGIMLVPGFSRAVPAMDNHEVVVAAL
jgi:hypothetical protein